MISNQMRFGVDLEEIILIEFCAHCVLLTSSRLASIFIGAPRTVARCGVHFFHLSLTVIVSDLDHGTVSNAP
jgi:hypothetical protein